MLRVEIVDIDFSIYWSSGYIVSSSKSFDIRKVADICFAYDTPFTWLTRHTPNTGNKTFIGIESGAYLDYLVLGLNLAAKFDRMSKMATQLAEKQLHILQWVAKCVPSAKSLGNAATKM